MASGSRFHYGWVVMLMGMLTTIGSHGFGRMTYTLILPPMKEELALTYTQAG
ncbi:MAG: MFS transporter, partial [Clostridia bacterium]|nr:MFS transporter [Clostridia bacterium]